MEERSSKGHITHLSTVCLSSQHVRTHLRPVTLGLQLEVWGKLEAFDTLHVVLPVVVELPEDLRLDDRVVLGEDVEQLEGCVCVASNVVLLQ